MNKDWALFDWSTVGLELDNRAKFYSTSGKLISESASEGVIFFQQLQQRIFVDEPKINSWESIFEPLIWKLIKEQNILWLCLGHFTGDRSNSKRRWLYYFSEDLSYEISDTCEEKLENIARAFRAMSFNVSYKIKADDCLLMTSRFLEMISEINSKDHIRYPSHGASLILSLNESPVDWKDKIASLDYFIIASLQELYAEILKDTKRHELLREAANNQVIKQFITESFNTKKQLVEFYWQNEIKRIEDEMWVDQYAQKLKSIFSGKNIDIYKYIETLKTDKLRIIEDPEFHRKIATYAAFAFDVSPKTGGIITVPAWLPSEGTSGRSGAIIMYTKHGYQISQQDLMGFTSAFRLGCVNIPIEATRLTAIKGSLHHIPKTFAAGIGHISKWHKEGKIPYIPSEFMIATWNIYQATQDPINMPRWEFLERILLEKGFNEYILNYLFINVAEKLGFNKLRAKKVYVTNDFFPTFRVNILDVSGNANKFLKEDTVASLIVLIAVLLTEAWEHTAYYSFKIKENKEIIITVSNQEILIENPCDYVYQSNRLLSANSNQSIEISSLELHSKCDVNGPDMESIKKGKWLRTIKRRKDD